ncbi:MAG: hypothetical protein DSZ26_01330 [Thermovibrio sp.]|nr:MAG: hypothetical protein DSZ26_01330 [Thermovibrio sp.]
MKVSACIIAKNEERNLPRLLRSLKGKFDEIILVDTGSKDKTKEIAKSYGCKVIEHKWKGFADARNRAVEEAKGDWLWHFDADFELDELEYKKALSAMRKAPRDIEAFSIGVKNFGKKGEIKAISFHIFIHRKGIKWIGKVHESPDVRNVIGIPVFVNHYGYADSNLLLRKARRNLKLLTEEIAEIDRGTDEYNYKLFFLVQTYILLSSENKSYISKALHLAKEFLQSASDRFSDYGFFLVYMYNYYLYLLWETGQRNEVEKILAHIFDLNLELPEFFFYAYKLFKEKEDINRAFSYILKTAEYLDILTLDPFSLKWGGASECLPVFEREIFSPPIPVPQEKLKSLWRKWKTLKGRNLGLLLYWLEPNKNLKLKILKKLSLRYRDNFIYKLLLRQLEELNLFDVIEEFSKKDIPLSLLFKARFYDIKGEDFKALKLYLSYLNEYPDMEIANYVVNRFCQTLKSFNYSPIIEDREQKF